MDYRETIYEIQDDGKIVEIDSYTDQLFQWQKKAFPTVSEMARILSQGGEITFISNGPRFGHVVHAIDAIPAIAKKAGALYFLIHQKANGGWMYLEITPA